MFAERSQHNGVGSVCPRIIPGASFQMKRPATPLFGSDIGNGFREVPSVSVKILSIVLAFAVGVLLGFTQDGGSIVPRAIAVAGGILDANLNGVRTVRRHVSFGDGEAALAGLHLDAVIGNAQPDSEAKSLGQPIGGCIGVGINEHRNDGTGRDGSVGSHAQTLPPPHAKILRRGLTVLNSRSQVLPSSGAAEQCSPGRKSWVCPHKGKESPVGRQKRLWNRNTFISERKPSATNLDAF
jgi:hypothetical protein